MTGSWIGNHHWLPFLGTIDRFCPFTGIASGTQNTGRNSRFDSASRACAGVVKFWISQMMNSIPGLIETCFKSHEDGEFLVSNSSIPFTYFTPDSAHNCQIYSTKPRTLHETFLKQHSQASFGIIGKYGLPSLADCQLIRQEALQKPLLFIGDMDPVDLLIFFWIRHHVGDGLIKFLGICDHFLNALRINVSPNWTMPLSSGEISSISMLRHIAPDLENRIGTECNYLLENNTKLEMEGVVNFNLISISLIEKHVGFVLNTP